MGGVVTTGAKNPIVRYRLAFGMTAQRFVIVVIVKERVGVVAQPLMIQVAVMLGLVIHQLIETFSDRQLVALCGRTMMLIVDSKDGIMSTTDCVMGAGSKTGLLMSGIGKDLQRQQLGVKTS